MNAVHPSPPHEDAQYRAYRAFRCLAQDLFRWLEQRGTPTLDAIASSFRDISPAIPLELELRMLLESHCDRCGALLPRSVLGYSAYATMSYTQLCPRCYQVIGTPQDAQTAQARALALTAPDSYWAALILVAEARGWSFSMLADELEVAPSRLLALLGLRLPHATALATQSTRYARKLGLAQRTFGMLVQEGYTLLYQENPPS